MVISLGVTTNAKSIDTRPKQSQILESGTSYLTITAKDQVSLLDVETSKVLQVFKADTTYVHEFALSLDEKVLAIAASGGVFVFEFESGKLISMIPAKHYIYDIDLNRDGSRCLVGTSRDGAAIYDTRTAKQTLHFDYEEGILGVALSPDGTKAVLVGLDQKVLFYDAVNGEKIGDTIEGRWPLCFSRDGKHLAISDSEHAEKSELQILDVNTMKVRDKVPYSGMKKLRAVDGGFIYITCIDKWKAKINAYFLEAKSAEPKLIWSKPQDDDYDLIGADFLPSGKTAVVTDWKYQTSRHSIQ
jgi:WD40 repeat protein